MARRAARNVSGVRGAGKVDPTIVYRLYECACGALVRVKDEAEGDAEPSPCAACNKRVPWANLREVPRWKYCRVCGELKPLEAFHRHRPAGRSFRSGRQLECRTCKNTRINPVLNPLRTPDQHRESGDLRRLYSLASGGRKVDTAGTFEKFRHRCFKCRKLLTPETGRMDHTLPVRLLWPLSEGPTLLCDNCNGAKAEKWPSEFYDDKELRRLAVHSGIQYETLRGRARVNPQALERIRAEVDDFLARWIKYPKEIRRLRDVIRKTEGIDIFAWARVLPGFLRDPGE